MQCSAVLTLVLFYFILCQPDNLLLIQRRGLPVKEGWAVECSVSISLDYDEKGNGNKCSYCCWCMQNSPTNENSFHPRLCVVTSLTPCRQVDNTHTLAPLSAFFSFSSLVTWWKDQVQGEIEFKNHSPLSFLPSSRWNNSTGYWACRCVYWVERTYIEREPTTWRVTRCEWGTAERERKKNRFSLSRSFGSFQTHWLERFLERLEIAGLLMVKRNQVQQRIIDQRKQIRQAQQQKSTIRMKFRLENRKNKLLIKVG